MAFEQPQIRYKNDDLVRRKLNPEPRTLRWTLKQECVEQVKLRLLQWARAQPVNREGLADEEPPYALDNCPTTLLQEVLFSVLTDESNSQPLKKVAEHLLVNGLNEFDFNCINDVPFDQLERIFYLVKQNGNYLKSLRLVGQWTYSRCGSAMLRELLQSCPNLERCTLQEAHYEEILCVARNCLKLMQLEVLHPSLNHVDVASLQMIGQNEKFSIQHSLRRLTLPSSVDGRSVLAMLELFPHITDLTCVHLEDLMAAAVASESAISRCAKISSLRVPHVMGWNSIETLVKIFPNLNRLSLKIQEIMNVQHIANLDKLTSICLENSQVIPSSSTEDVLPLLRNIGHRLTHLRLIYFDVIELPKIDFYCPQLRALDLQQFTLLGCITERFQRLQRGFADHPFKQLRFLHMRPRQGQCISQEACLILLKGCHHLVHLDLHDAFGMTDALVNVLAELNSFMELRQICLRGGHNLSRIGIETLLSHSTQLRLCHFT